MYGNSYLVKIIDDNTLFVVADNIRDVMQSLDGFCENLQMKWNHYKCQPLLNTKEQATLKSREFAPSTIFTKCSILDTAAVLDPPLSEQL